MRRIIPAITGGLLLVSVTALPAQTLRGSRVAMERQHTVARQQDYSFLTTSAQVRKFVDLGLLVTVRPTADLKLVGVSHPVARPALKTFIDRLSRQYRAACGEQLVVTSLTRPTREQPRNASDLSVHPAGMAVDLRISSKGSCQRWLQKTLLSLEERGVLDATRERRPPHYHIAVFPERYLAYVQKLGGSSPAARLASTRRPAEADDASDVGTAEEPVIVAASLEPAADTRGPAVAETAPAPETAAAPETYRVGRGDTLWSLARRFGTTVEQLKEANNLRGSRIAAGQVITIPAGNVAP